MNSTEKLYGKGIFFDGRKGIELFYDQVDGPPGGKRLPLPVDVWNARSIANILLQLPQNFGHLTFIEKITAGVQCYLNMIFFKVRVLTTSDEIQILSKSFLAVPCRNKTFLGWISRYTSLGISFETYAIGYKTYFSRIQDLKQHVCQPVNESRTFCYRLMVLISVWPFTIEKKFFFHGVFIPSIGSTYLVFFLVQLVLPKEVTLTYFAGVISLSPYMDKNFLHTL